MEKIIKKLEEQITFMQQEIAQLSDEIYTQQKEITQLTREAEKLKDKLYNIEDDKGIKDLNDENPPPHY